MDFEKKRLHEIVEGQKGGTSRYSALWQADRTKIMRMAPAEYMGRCMDEWWDYAIADEIHQLVAEENRAKEVCKANGFISCANRPNHQRKTAASLSG